MRLIDADELDFYFCDDVFECSEALCNAHTLTIDDLRPHGRWVQNGKCNHKPYRLRNPDKWVVCKCSVCGFSNGRRFNDKFCPNCGAKMDGSED